MSSLAWMIARHRGNISTSCVVREGVHDGYNSLLSGANASGEDSSYVGEQMIFTNSVSKSTYDGLDIIVRPISFSAPEEIWEAVVTYKMQKFAQVIPGNKSTYHFTDEDEYRKSYRYF